MKNDQLVALKFLLMRYREAAINTNMNMDEHNEPHIAAANHEEKMEQEIIKYVNSMIDSASKEIL